MRQAFLQWRRREIPLHVRILATLLVICTLWVGLAGYRTWQIRGQVIAADKVETANLARSLAQHAHDTLYVVDVILSGLRERFESGGPESSDRLDRTIAMRLNQTPQLCGLAVLDPAGRLVAGRQDAGASTADLLRLAYHRAHADRGVYVGDADRACDDGRWSLTVSSRIDDDRGRFAGIAEARISIDFLQRFYGSFAVGPHGLISMATRWGTILARTDNIQAGIGARVSSGTIFRMISAGRSAGSVRYVSLFDGIARFGSFRTIDGYPLYILVGHASDEVLAGWRASAWFRMVISLLGSMFLLLTGSRLAGQIRIRQQAERRYRLLAENSSDAIVCIGLDGKRLYVSPAFTVLTGWTVEEVIAKNASDIVFTEDLSAQMNQLPQLLAGAAQVTSCFRYVCKDGSLLWVEMRARLLRCDDGEMQIIANVRDITDRHAAEARVAALNRELAQQANTDGLTGVANRRRFDEALVEQWRRARHEGMPLSLLMIDVDRFKLFNDRYGHQRGDECLRAVAAAAAQVAQDPAALAARYGGEEFVLLLPRLDAADAAALAGRMLAAVRTMGIEHRDNGSVGVVTVSIGTATAMPCTAPDACDVTTLVAGADAALYEAKRGGRNRLVMRDDTPCAGLPWTGPIDPSCGAVADRKTSAFTMH